MPLPPRFRRFASLVAFAAIFILSRAAFAEESAFCAIERNVGMTPNEAAAIEDVVCDAARSAPSAGRRHRLHAVRLGSKIVLTMVSEGHDGRTTSKQLVLANVEEATVAAPRLIEAAADQKPVAETVTVTNVVGDETRRSKKKTTEIHGWLGMVGATSGRIGTGGGVNLGLSAGSDRWSFVGDLRVTGESFNKPAALALAIFTLGSAEIQPEAKFSFVSLSGGVRHHFSATDVSPFLGVGLGLDYIGKNNREPYEYAGYTYERRTKNGATGLAGYAELGLDVLRTHAVGGAFVLRVDAPTFTHEEKVTTSTPSRIEHTTRYTPIFGAGIAMRF